MEQPASTVRANKLPMGHFRVNTCMESTRDKLIPVYRQCMSISFTDDRSYVIQNSKFYLQKKNFRS